PLVFWDEFDSTVSGQPLAWLKYFLSPMQDGSFQAGPFVHPVGRAIFAFAGSVEPTMQKFEELAINEPHAKGKDFVSRLKGFVNMLGPDQQEPEPSAGTPKSESDREELGQDSQYILRRAMILRGVLKRERKGLFEGDLLRIDPGVLR